jgi:hypothetical protein
VSTLIFSIGSTLYRVQAADSMLNLAPFWNTAEFNIFGVGGGSQATFNAGSTIVVRNSVTNGTGMPQTCVNNGNGFTGETNNPSLGACAPSASPGIVFTESNVPGGVDQQPVALPYRPGKSSRRRQFHSRPPVAPPNDRYLRVGSSNDDHQMM